MLEIVDKVLLSIHIIAGTASLLLFWIPVMSRKGGTVHKKSGHFYYINMWVVQISAILLSLINAWQGDML